MVGKPNKSVDKSSASVVKNEQAQGVWSSDHTLFLGEYTHKMDDKGRLALPAKFRAQLSAGAVVTCGPDKVLHLYSTDHWKPMAEKLAALPAFSSKEARVLQRTVLGRATAVTPDRQGRILLPASLREYGGLVSPGVAGTDRATAKTTDVVVVGLYGRVEIWPADRWRKERKEVDLEEIAPKLADLGI